jgi:hypothetical protein
MAVLFQFLDPFEVPRNWGHYGFFSYNIQSFDQAEHNEFDNF